MRRSEVVAPPTEIALFPEIAPLPVKQYRKRKRTPKPGATLVIEPVKLGRPLRMGETVPCGSCKTTGKTKDEKDKVWVPCPYCDGWGYTYQPWKEPE